MAGKAAFRFSFGPWNIHEGADVFGPPVRSPIARTKKIAMVKKLGFTGVQFHDDDVVENLDVSPEQIAKEAREMKKVLDGEGLVPEFVAPRLWEHPMTIDGGYTANDPARQGLRHGAQPQGSRYCQPHRGEEYRALARA